MTCQHCSGELPPYALFCGECGRSVSAPSIVPPTVNRPTVPASAAPASAEAPVSIDSLAAVLSEVPSDVPAERPEELRSIPTPASPHSAPGQSENRGDCAQCGTTRAADDRFCAECGRPLPSDTAIIEPITVATAATDASVIEGTEQQRAKVDPVPGDVIRFVLQFSTGESYTVLGSGLVGRSPRPEPGEFVEHLVTVVDPGRSVSKTHVEFGHDAGDFWVSDRHSGNGTVIREPGAEARLCEPGRRYFVVRGTRIDLGEQFVVVS